MVIKKLKVVFIVIIIVSIVISFLLSPIFSIKEIYIKETDNYKYKDIYDNINLSIGNNIFLVLLKDGNVLSLEFNNLEQQLHEKYKLLTNINVKAQLPGTININYDIAKPALEFIKEGKFIVTDDEGYVLKVEDSHKKGRIRITGLAFSKYTLYEYINRDEEKMKNIKIIYNELLMYDSKYFTAFREYINWIDLSSEENIAIMYDNRVLVKLKAKDDIEYKIASMCVILSQQVGPAEKGILDMTKGNSSIFSPE